MAPRGGRRCTTSHLEEQERISHWDGITVLTEEHALYVLALTIKMLIWQLRLREFGVGHRRALPYFTRILSFSPFAHQIEAKSAPFSFLAHRWNIKHAAATLPSRGQWERFKPEWR